MRMINLDVELCDKNELKPKSIIQSQKSLIMNRKNEKTEKSTLQVELENEAKAKEIIEKEQIKELNRAMIQGLDLNKAAKNIYGQKEKPGKSNATPRLKSKDEMKFNANWHE